MAQKGGPLPRVIELASGSWSVLLRSKNLLLKSEIDVYFTSDKRHHLFQRLISLIRLWRIVVVFPKRACLEAREIQCCRAVRVEGDTSSGLCTKREILSLHRYPFLTMPVRLSTSDLSG